MRVETELHSIPDTFPQQEAKFYICAAWRLTIVLVSIADCNKSRVW